MLHPEVNFKRYLANEGFEWMNRGNMPIDGLGKLLNHLGIVASSKNLS